MSVFDIYSSRLECHEHIPPSIGQCLDDSLVEAPITRECDELLKLLGFEDTFSGLAEKENNRSYHVVESNVGDDANVTTDSTLYGVVTLCAAKHISFIKLSMKDIGMSKILANYAEGWMLTPPTAASSFEAVNRNAKGYGLAFTLDPVKLKLLSAVRKQSSEEMDLESKLSHLADIAAWTDRSWFTYDFHQMALVLANCVFDFNDARSFPFLYKTEGGSGGLPPYGNLSTAYSALHYYTRGKSKRAILGIMQECVMISHSDMAPKDSYFLRASHLAHAGDPTWARFETAYRTLLKGRSLTRAEARGVLHEIQGVELPPDIMSRGYDVEPEDFTVGSAIGHLRSKGYLLTEVDVKLLQQKVEKSKAVFGKIPIADILVSQDEEAKKFKSSCAKILTELYGGDKTIRAEVDGKLGLIGDTYEDFCDVAEDYYRIRSDTNSEFTSFFYTDSIRVFKTRDIEEYFGMKDPGLAQDFGLTDDLPDVKPPPLEYGRERIEQARISAWLDSGPINEVLRGSLPTGLGTDDARIIKEILDEPVDPNSTGMVFVLVTDDSGLLRTAVAKARVKSQVSGQAMKVCQIRRNDYTALCLLGIKEDYEANSPRFRHRFKRKYELPIYNYIMDRDYPMPDDMVEHLLQGIPGNWRRTVQVKVLYDVPNMERGLERTFYRRDTNTVVVTGGGHLSRLTIETMPTSKSWAELPIGTIAAWDDFSPRRRKTLYAKNIKVKGVALISAPRKVASNRGITHWLERTLSSGISP